ncbi:WS/DGAT/MGAT family O-acyltransferase [Skermania piniformis]|uniref:Diacylglycerol O-acyltransferase n=1 Tax=Skermania pinensis TaxID=39122 RepID=A0ABX8SBL4_9ACTN|nr:wax ester/triacylglycerol synthase family O-acyltransferase [Skermania piniformis]QXQ14577.1 wax ester/triacylglycerol synthase family O-acyltransferase [Skermania piniformis]
MKFLSAVDQMMLRMESPRTPMHIGALAIFRRPAGAGPGYARRVYQAFKEAAFLPFPFDSVVADRLGVAGVAWWQEVRPDLDYHIRLSAVPAPGTDRELGLLIERLHSTALDLSKPLWEAHIIEGLADGRFAFYFKAHHAAVDGMGAVNLIRAWLSTEPGVPQVPETEPEPDPDNLTLLRRIFETGLRGLGRGVVGTGEVAGRLVGMAAGANSSISAAVHTPATPFNGRVNRHRRVAVGHLRLDTLKAVAAATGATVNDAVLASVGAGVRRYLTERDALPSRSVMASVPVGFERDPDTLNAATGFVCPLGTDIEDPVERLATISAGTTRGKAELLAMSPNAQTSYTVLGLVPLLIGQKTGLLAKVPALFNFTVSSVVLGAERLYLGDAELELMVPISFLVDGYGLNLTLIGYAGDVALGFVGCRDSIPHVQRLATYTEAGLTELAAAVSPDSSAT